MKNKAYISTKNRATTVERHYQERKGSPDTPIFQGVPGLPIHQNPYFTISKIVPPTFWSLYPLSAGSPGYWDAFV